MTLYFAYGSNMSQDELERYFKDNGRAWVRRKPRVAELKDYRLDFNYESIKRRAGAANIMESAGNSVFGLLFEVTDREFEMISRKEGKPNSYDEKEVEVIADEQPMPAITFKVIKKKEVEFQKPAGDYMRLLIETAVEYGFPEWYRDFLRSIETVTPGAAV